MRLRALLFAALASTSPAAAQVLRKPTPAAMDPAVARILTRSALLALDQANKTGNYTVLRDLGAAGFQVNTAARLSEIFANQRRDRLDLSVTAVLEPQFTLPPQIEPNGLLHMAGFFPSAPAPVNFDLAYANQDGQWRLFGISVGLGDGAPQRQEAQQAQGPAPAPARR